jgi:hypothetical protein
VTLRFLNTPGEIKSRSEQHETQSLLLVLGMDLRLRFACWLSPRHRARL